MQTSCDSLHCCADVGCECNRHDTLVRMVLDNIIRTVQGCTKGMNHDALTAANDMIAGSSGNAPPITSVMRRAIFLPFILKKADSKVEFSFAEPYLYGVSHLGLKRSKLKLSANDENFIMNRDYSHISNQRNEGPLLDVVDSFFFGC